MLIVDGGGLTDAASAVEATAGTLEDLDVAGPFATASDALAGSRTSESCIWGVSTRLGAAVQVWADRLRVGGVGHQPDGSPTSTSIPDQAVSTTMQGSQVRRDEHADHPRRPVLATGGPRPGGRGDLGLKGRRRRRQPGRGCCAGSLERALEDAAGPAGRSRPPTVPRRRPAPAPVSLPRSSSPGTVLFCGVLDLATALSHPPPRPDRRRPAARGSRSPTTAPSPPRPSRR